MSHTHLALIASHRFRRHDFRILCLALFVSLIGNDVQCTPTYGSGSIQDDWAQLLHADRYTMVRLPQRALHGAPFVHTPTNHIGSPLDNTRFSSAAAPKTRPLVPHSVDVDASTARYTGPDGNSRFECTVEGAPQGLDVNSALGIALSVVSDTWRSTVVVNTLIRFQELGNSSILAAGGGTYFIKLGSPLQSEIIIPVASAEAIRGKDLNGNLDGDGKYDVVITLNIATPWYAGSGSPSESQYDLATVLLHEIYHNLVFAGSVVAKMDSTSGGITQQTAYLYKSYKTRFDMFLATPSGCGVLQYLTADSLSRATGKSTGQLLADAVCSNNLYFAYGNQIIAKLHAPRIFQFRSSIYHLDVTEVGQELMHPTIRLGFVQHSVGQKILSIQEITLDPSKAGCETTCQLTTPSVGPDPPGGGYVHNPSTDEPPLFAIGGSRVGGLPIWGFILILLLALLFLILLLLLCFLLCIRRRKRGGSSRASEYWSYVYSSLNNRGSRGTQSKSKSVHGGMVEEKESHDSWSKHRRHSSRHSHHTGKSSKKAVSGDVSKKGSSGRCPSTGKKIIICCCNCCKAPVKRPPPIASVHTWDPESVPSTEKKSDRCKKSCRRRHKHEHDVVDKVVSKVCKTRTTCPDPCQRGPVTGRCTKTTRCTTTVTRRPSRRTMSHTKSGTSVKNESSRASKGRSHLPSTKVADHCVQSTTCSPKKTRGSTTRPSTTTCPPTTTCLPSTMETCRTCRKGRSGCRCPNFVEVQVNYRC